MALLLAHPFRILPSGVAATLDDATDEYAAQSIAILIQTQPGERALVPAFGLNDPTFDDLSSTEVQVGCDMFGPDVTILDVTKEIVDARSEDVFVTFEQSGDES